MAVVSLLLMLFFAGSTQAESVAFPPDWLTCASDDDCVLVYYSCSGATAVNKSNADAAQSKLNEIYGTMSELKCAVRRAPHYEAHCSKNVCFSTSFDE